MDWFYRWVNRLARWWLRLDEVASTPAPMTFAALDPAPPIDEASVAPDFALSFDAAPEPVIDRTECPNCHNLVHAWRTYANGHVACVSCGQRRRR